ncbi:MAG: NAD-dependent epimerase/dehydratase family protein [Candidatus Hydrogenedentota bacterium]
MKIFVGGGAGFVGSVLAPVLLEHGYEVTVGDLLWFGNHLPDAVELWNCNLFDLQPADLEGFDQVVFLAGLSNDPMAEFSPARNFVENGALPSYLAFIARRAGVKRFVYGSSCSVYGYTINELYDEESPVTSAYPYAISKLQGERGVLQVCDGDFSAIALRQGTVCGHSPRMRFDLIVNTMFKAAMQEGRITVNNPAIWRPILDVRDSAAAFLRAIQADYGISGAFNVAYDNYTVGQIADFVKDEVERLSGKRVQIENKNAADLRNYKVSCQKARTRLGFAPRYDVSDMVRTLYSRREEYGDFERKEYYNIRVFKELA